MRGNLYPVLFEQSTSAVEIALASVLLVLSLRVGGTTATTTTRSEGVWVLVCVIAGFAPSFRGIYADQGQA